MPIRTLSEESTRRLSKQLKRVEQQSYGGGKTHNEPLQRDNSANCYNVEASADCPGYGVMLLNGMTTIAGYKMPETKRPDTFGCQQNFLIAERSGITHSKEGCYQTAGLFGPDIFIAAYDSGDGTPGLEECWGPRSGSFLLRKGTGGFRIIDVLDSSNHWVLVKANPMDSFYGKNAGSKITKGSAGTINIYSGTYTSEADTGATMSSVLARFGHIEANAMVQCFLSKTASGTDSKSAWYAIETDTCPT